MRRRAFLASTTLLLAGCRGDRDRPEPPPPDTDVVPVPRRRLGLNVHNLAPSVLARVADLNVTQVRYPVYWNRWLYEPGYREIVAGDVNCGFEVLVVLNGLGELPDLGGFVEMARDIHALNPANPLQLWNEADHIEGPGNGWQFFGGDPARYCAHLEEVRRAVPDATLVSTGLADDGGVLMRWAGALNLTSVNAIALHSYGPPPARNYRGKARLARLHSAKPLWNTEFGSPHPRANQTQDIAECAPFDDYHRSYVFCLDTGHVGFEYNLTAESEAWLKEWNA